MPKENLKLLSLLVGITFLVQCKRDAIDGGLYLPQNFTSTVVIDSIEETVRHMAVSADGVVYAKLRNATEAGSIVALKDDDGNDYADIVKRFGAYGGKAKWSYATAMRIYNGYLYHSSD
ncbi:MAG: cytochrome C, partial [Eudoraea sp.]|nr:cytochrome C [Eudoraea sp.]